MSFLEENKYFLQSFFSDLRKLDTDSEPMNYENYKNKIKTKTSEYYQKIDGNDDAKILPLKNSFYVELVDCFGQYDFDYILINLFLDKDFIRVLESLRTKAKFNLLLEQSRTSLAFFLKGLNRRLNNTMSTERAFSDYLKSVFSDFIPIDDNTWNETNYTNKSSINHKYAQYLIESVALDSPYWQSIIYNHLLFIKVYNHLDYFDKNKASKNILFINEIISCYKLKKRDNDVKLGQLINKIDNEIHSNCFANYIKTPVCMSESTAYNISDGLANRIKEFDSLLDIRTVVAKSNQSTYYDLYKLSDRISLEELNKYLDEKMSAGYFIIEDDIQKIEGNSGSNSNQDMNRVKQQIFKKFYLFEKIELSE